MGRAGAPAGARGSADIAGAVLAAPIVDTVKRELGGSRGHRGSPGLVAGTDAAGVCLCARCARRLKEAARAGIAVTDEAQAMERMGLRPALVQGSPFNVKVTRAEDLAVAASILKMTEEMPMRVGQGFDVHAFGEGDHVMLGGVRIAHAQGHRRALGRRRGHSRAVRRAAGRHGRRRHRPAFSRQRSALSRRRQPRVPARGGGAHAGAPACT